MYTERERETHTQKEKIEGKDRYLEKHGSALSPLLDMQATKEWYAEGKVRATAEPQRERDSEN